MLSAECSFDLTGVGKEGSNEGRGGIRRLQNAPSPLGPGFDLGPRLPNHRAGKAAFVPRPRARADQSQNRGFVRYGGRVKAVQSLAALWMFLTLPHAPLPRRCVFDPWVLGANVGSKLCGELSFERPLHFI